MENREEVLQYGLSFPDTYVEAPFHDANWQLVRVKGSKKAFLWTYEKDGYINLNVKADLEWRDYWRSAFKSVIPGWSDGINTYDPGDKISIKKDTRFYAIWEEVIPESNSESNITKAASTMYFDTLIRRTSGDEAWYDTVGSYSIKSLKDYSNDSCVQIWKIDIDGNITRMK